MHSPEVVQRLIASGGLTVFRYLAWPSPSLALRDVVAVPAPEPVEPPSPPADAAQVSPATSSPEPTPPPPVIPEVATIAPGRPGIRRVATDFVPLRVVPTPSQPEGPPRAPHPGPSARPRRFALLEELTSPEAAEPPAGRRLGSPVPYRERRDPEGR